MFDIQWYMSPTLPCHITKERNNFIFYTLIPQHRWIKNLTQMFQQLRWNLLNYDMDLSSRWRDAYWYNLGQYRWSSRIQVVLLKRENVALNFRSNSTTHEWFYSKHFLTCHCIIQCILSSESSSNKLYWITITTFYFPYV